MNQQKPKYLLDAATAYNILKAIPDHSRGYQTHQEDGYDNDFVGTVKEFLSTFEDVKESSGDLLWNVHDKTVVLIELLIIRAEEIIPDADCYEHYVLLMYADTNENLELPKLGTKEKRPDPRYVRSINLSRPVKA